MWVSRPDVKIAGHAGHGPAQERHVVRALAFEPIHVAANGQPSAKAGQHIRLDAPAKRPGVEREHNPSDLVGVACMASIVAVVHHVPVVAVVRHMPVVTRGWPVRSMLPGPEPSRPPSPVPLPGRWGLCSLFIR